MIAFPAGNHWHEVKLPCGGHETAGVETLDAWRSTLQGTTTGTGAEAAWPLHLKAMRVGLVF